MTSIHLGVDIGGTFTDVACLDESGNLGIAKVLTTPESPDQGVGIGIRELLSDLGAVTSFVHGTTLVINALLERKGCPTALVTTKGFRDVIGMGRGNRPQAFNLMYGRLPPLIERNLCIEIDERVSGSGVVLTEPRWEEIESLAEILGRAEVEAVAVAFVNAYLAPENEERVASGLRELLPDVFVGTSTSVSGQWREYERFNSAAANASVGPLTDHYLASIEASLERLHFRGSFSLLDSAGGALHPITARRVPLRLIESGPVGGVLGAVRAARELNLGHLVTFDVGGTTAKSATIENGNVREMDIYHIGGYEVGLPIQVPSIDILEVGAGGGSLAWLASDGELRVGPRSAGAWPGPACYGRGGMEPTVTDANLVCGRLVPEFFQASIDISAALAYEAVQRLASAAGTTLDRMAAGVVELANASMADMVRRQTVELGRDPHEFSLLAIGGAGPTHAADVARAVGIRRVIIPPSPGHFSAMGMLNARRRLDRRQGWVRKISVLDNDEFNDVVDRLGRELEVQFKVVTGSDDIAADSQLELQTSVAVRYFGQEHTLTIDLAQDGMAPGDNVSALIRSNFEREYSRRFGRRDTSSDIEITEVKVVALQVVKEETIQLRAHGATDMGRGTVEILMEGGRQRVRAVIRSRVGIAPGERVFGPAVVYENGANTFVPSDASMIVDETGFAYIEL